MGKWVHRLKNLQPDKLIGECDNCGLVKISHVGGGKYRCSISRSIITMRCKKNRQKVMYAKGQLCEICHREEKLYYEHCHTTGKHRGWVCHRCNLVLGFAQDNPDVLKNAISYLEARR